MPDRTINFGESEAEATYQIQDTDGAAGGGNFVVAKDTNANTVLLEYDPGTDTWEYAGDVDLNGGTLTAGSVNTDEITNGPLYAGNFSGADADARLDNAIASADVGDEVVLETADYTVDRTINFQGAIKGPSWGSIGQGASATVSGKWTLAGNNSFLMNVVSFDDEIVVSADRCRLSQIYEVANGITIQGDEVGVYSCRQPNITFESGTSDGIAVGNTVATITDNGTNIIGDNS